MCVPDTKRIVVTYTERHNIVVDLVCQRDICFCDHPLSRQWGDLEGDLGDNMDSYLKSSSLCHFWFNPLSHAVQVSGVREEQ